MIVLLNRHACAGKAGTRWDAIEPLFRNTCGPYELIDAGKNFAAQIARYVAEGETRFTAAGGDGTVNMLLNAIAGCTPVAALRVMQIGAVGLGSSNDFHKPFAQGRRLGSFACRLDFVRPMLHDLGIIRWADGNGSEHARVWINNASIGVTAEANISFNDPSAAARRLKQLSTGTAILVTAVGTILAYRAIRGTVSFDGAPGEEIRVTNLGIVKNPHFSGSFCYDTPYDRTGGCFYAHLCQGMTTMQTLRTLRRLSHARFSGGRGTSTRRASTLRFEAAHPFSIEYDGETATTRCVDFSVIREAVQLCS